MDRTGEPRYEGLPAVLQPDLTPDTTAYTTDMLSQLKAAATAPTVQIPVTAALLQYAAATAAAPSQVQEQLLSFCMENATNGLHGHLCANTCCDACRSQRFLR
jgi:hypothetical protein